MSQRKVQHENRAQYSLTSISPSGKFRFGACTLKSKPCNEDSFSYRFVKTSKTMYNIFGVFDGHLGYDASKYCQRFLFKFIEKKIGKDEMFCSDDEKIRKCFVEFDGKYRRFFNNVIMKKKEEYDPGYSSGCNASIFIVIENGNNVEVISVLLGDALFSIEGVDNDIYNQEISPHVPSVQKEKDRIEKAKGKIEMQCGVKLAVTAEDSQIMLLMTRCFGDFELKHRSELKAEEQPVSVIPEIKRYKFNSTDEIKMILATDGAIRFDEKTKITGKFLTDYKKKDCLKKGFISNYSFLSIDMLVNNRIKEYSELQEKYIDHHIDEKLAKEIIEYKGIKDENKLKSLDLGKMCLDLAYNSREKHPNFFRPDDYCDDSTMILIYHNEKLNVDTSDIVHTDLIEEEDNYSDDDLMDCSED